MRNTPVIGRALACLVVAAALTVAGLGLGCGKPPACGTLPTTPCASTRLTVSGVLPNTGPSGSAVAVHILGTGFEAGATVTIDGVATNGTVVSNLLITATVPAHPLGPVDVVVTNAGGQSSRLTAAYTYVPVAVATVSPSTGLGGEPVRITGTGFLPGATLTLDGVAATLTGLSGTVISATTPIHSAGVVDVVVTNPGGQSGTLGGGYSYGAVSLTASSSVVTAGAPLSVSWTAPSGRFNGDWVALFKVGDPNSVYDWWAYTEGATSGTLTLTAPAQPGQYEFRYLINDDLIDVRRSSPVTVTGDLARLFR